MKTLAIDIGGTKFSMAVFDSRCMVARESRETDREGGREWMMEQIYQIAAAWRAEHDVARCGIGFGGPVIFSEQRVALSTHVGGWNDFDLPGTVGTSTIYGFDGAHLVSDVSISSFRVGGVLKKTLTGARITKNAHTTNITIR